MATHGQSPPTDEEAPQEETEQSPPTYEEKLTREIEEGGLAPQQQISFQAFLGLAFGASTHALEIKSSLDLLKGEIDVEKLVTDPAYKAQVERAVKLVNRYGPIVKKDELIEKVPKIERIIERTNDCHSKLNATKSEFLLSDKYYLQQLQKAYGFDEKQLKTMTDGAWARVRENPSLSIKDALTMEATNFSLKPVTKEVENENKGKRLKPEEKKALIEKKLAEKQKAFETSLTRPDAKTGEVKSYAEYENKRIAAIIKTQVEENKQILSAKIPPETSTIPAPSSISAAPPVSMPPPTMSPPSVSIPRFTLPNFSLPKLPNISLPPGLSNVFSGIGDGIKSGLGSLFKSGGGLSKGLNLAKNAVTKLLPKLASFALPPLGAALTALSAIDALTGGLITKGAAILVGGVAALVIVVPLIIGVGMFSSFTGSNPMTITSSNENPLSWHEFNKEYLTIENDNQKDKLGAGDTNPITWQQFEKDNLSPLKQYLSLEK